MVAWKALTCCALLILAAQPALLQEDPPAPPGGEGSGAQPPPDTPTPTDTATATTVAATSPVAATTPTTAQPPVAAQPPVFQPPTTAPPTDGGAMTTATPGTAPMMGMMGSPMDGGAATTGTPGSSPMMAAADTPAAGPALDVAALSPVVAAAPGPDGTGTVDTGISLLSDGALNADQQQQLCQAVLQGLSGDFSDITQCTVTSQAMSDQPSFATTGRRLHQTTTSTLALRIVLSPAQPQQVGAIQNILNTLQISIGQAPPTQIVVINITFLNLIVQTAPVPPTPGRQLPPSTPLRLTPPGTPPGTLQTAVAMNATRNTTMGVTQTQLNNTIVVPQGGTRTQTTVTNSTTTTQIITIAVFQIDIQITVIQQFFFTFTTGQTVGVLTRVNFNLQGNVAQNVPPAVTGGAVTGQTTTRQVTGVTVTVVQTTNIQTTTRTTTTTTTTGGGGGGGTGGGGGNNGGIIPGTTRQICSVPNNPYGIIQNNATEGTLVKGAFLVSVWNDRANNPGQGNIIYQCLPNGTTTVWANVTVTGACRADNAGVGLTMALSRCGSVIIVGSLPIRPRGRPSPGCLIALDTSGRVVNEVTSQGINGPWGSVCTTNGNSITLAVSNVLGGLAPTTPAASGGRKLQQAQAPGPSATNTGGFLVRWTFNTPTAGSTWNLGSPTFLVTGVRTNGSQVANGNVGPGQPTVDTSGTVYLPDNLGNRILAIPNGLTTASNGVGGQPLALTAATNGARPVNGPNSVFFAGNQLLGTNTMDGNLFVITLNAARNGGTSALTLADPQNTPGVLFQAVVSLDSAAGAPVGSVWFVHDGTNTLNTIVTSGSSTASPGSGSNTASPGSGSSTTSGSITILTGATLAVPASGPNAPRAAPSTPQAPPSVPQAAPSAPRPVAGPASG